MWRQRDDAKVPTATTTGEKPRTKQRRRGRRTQAERSADTRARLLEATVSCLAEVGYGRTTVAEVAARAGVSKGAHLHHYRTKADLVTAALDDVLRRRQQQFLEACERLPSGGDRGGAIIDLLWSMFEGPTFAAWVELVVAARTDAELGPRVAEVERSLAALVFETFLRLFVVPGQTLTPQQATGLPMLFALFEGLAFQRLLEGAPDYSEPVLAAAKSLAHLFLPQPP